MAYLWCREGEENDRDTSEKAAMIIELSWCRSVGSESGKEGNIFGKYFWAKIDKTCPFYFWVDGAVVGEKKQS